MEKKIKVRLVEDEALWDRFVAVSPQGTVFSSSNWIKAGAQAMGGEPVFLGVWDGPDLVAGVSFVEIVRGPLRKAATPVLTPYGGFLYDGGREDAQSDRESQLLLCAEKLIGALKKKYHHVFLVHTPRLGDIRPFSWQNWTENVRYTYLIDLDDPEKMLRNMRERARRKIQKAEETVKTGGSLSPERIGSLYGQIFSDRDTEPPLSPGMIVSMVRSLEKTGVLKITTASDAGDELAALQVLVVGADTVYTWIYGTLPGKNHTGADSLLIWDVMRRYHATHKTLDLVGANIPSIAFFKKGFGGMLTPYYVTSYYSSMTARAVFRAYTAVRKTFRL